MGSLVTAGRSLLLAILLTPPAALSQRPPAPSEATRPDPIARLQAHLVVHGKGTPWHFVSGTEQQKAAMRKMVAEAPALKYFPGYRLIRLIHWNPAAGYPGSVSADLRIVQHRVSGLCHAPTPEWIATFRKAQPLDVDAMSDAERAAYLSELVSLTTLRDHRGFAVKSLEKLGPRRYRLRHVSKHPMGPRVLEETLEFDPNGAVLPGGRLFSGGL
ncbi:MAG: hypothetical protein P1V51_23295 [Deltaproteobacteria bacterium]|nr:hypothetical protein [Deltaproteobacteria bacterium]